MAMVFFVNLEMFSIVMNDRNQCAKKSFVMLGQFSVFTLPLANTRHRQAKDKAYLMDFFPFQKAFTNE